MRTLYKRFLKLFDTSIRQEDTDYEQLWQRLSELTQMLEKLRSECMSVQKNLVLLEDIQSTQASMLVAMCLPDTDLDTTDPDAQRASHVTVSEMAADNILERR